MLFIGISTFKRKKKNFFCLNSSQCSLIDICIQIIKKTQICFYFSGVRIAVYDRLRKKLDVSDNHSGLPLWEAAICGVVAGGLAQW